MSSTTFLLKGKYAGSTYSEILSKDLNYCLFLTTIKYPSPEIKTFVDYLNSINTLTNNSFLTDTINAKLEKDIARVTKLNSH